MLWPTILGKHVIKYGDILSAHEKIVGKGPIVADTFSAEIEVVLDKEPILAVSLELFGEGTSSRRSYK